jgi:hypothetical protein
MMLNLEKCVFEVSGGKRLGFLVSHWVIEANPEKTRVVKNMHHSVDSYQSWVSIPSPLFKLL